MGATAQSTSGQTTYSHDTVYVGTDGHLYDSDTQVEVKGHTHSYAASVTAGGPATNISVTNEIPNNTTRYCLYSDGVSGGQAAKANADLYYTGGTG